jgi:pyrroline-5-carboxylate reductase
MLETLAFIGAGNMARSLIGGLIAQGFAPNQIIVADAIASQRELTGEQFGIRVASSNRQAAVGSDVLVFAVKPQDLRAVAEDLAPALATRPPLVISVAAGIRARDLQRWLGGIPVVRTMPNRPALNGCGVSGLFASAAVPQSNRELAARIMGAVGPALWVDKEEHMDIVTAVSGSGPAYFFLLAEMVEAAGVALGLAPEVSRRLAIETAYGSGRMLREGNESAAKLREQVTSKGGTTEAALKYLESQDVRAIFAAAIKAAAQRSAELAAQLGGD